MIIYLCVKTHNITRLKYLCKTKKNPFKYKGSGLDWLTHLKHYGNNHSTEIIGKYKSNEELSIAGKYYSKLWQVVTAVDDFGSKIWANRIPETGGGGHDCSLANLIDSGFADSKAASQRNLKRVKAGTHNLLKQADGSSQSGDRVKAGKHHFVTNNPVNNLLLSGNHASKIKLSCRFCRKTTSKNQFTKLHSTCQEILPVIA